jgi:hypothetical protein
MINHNYEMTQRFQGKRAMVLSSKKEGTIKRVHSSSDKNRILVGIVLDGIDNRLHTCGIEDIKLL